MTINFRPQDLECPDPAECTVAANTLANLASSKQLPKITTPSSRHWFRIDDSRDGFGQPNPGIGDTRFAPFDTVESDQRVPALYLAETLEAALLETSLHNVHESARVVALELLIGKLHAQVIPPKPLTFVDLRDDQLWAFGLSRQNLVSSSQEHYPCTRRVAREIHADLDVDGIIWHSRQAELTERPRAEVAVVFADRVPHQRDSWNLAPHLTANGTLLEGAGRFLLDELTYALGVTLSEAPDFGD